MHFPLRAARLKSRPSKETLSLLQVFQQMFSRAVSKNI
jgi:hypothetical protein